MNENRGHGGGLYQKFETSILSKDKRIAKYLLWVLIALFILITAFVYFVPTSFIDINFSRAVQEEKNPALDIFMKVVSWFGETDVAVISLLLMGFLCFVYTYKREAAFVLLSGLASIINYGFKILISRPRPTEDLVEIISEAQFHSFPSGHVVHYVVFFGFVIFLMGRMSRLNNTLRLSLSILSIILIISVPFSRIYLGVHWFTDVLAGFFLGVILLSILLLLFLRSKRA